MLVPGQTVMSSGRHRIMFISMHVTVDEVSFCVSLGAQCGRHIPTVRSPITQ